MRHDEKISIVPISRQTDLPTEIGSSAASAGETWRRRIEVPCNSHVDLDLSGVFFISGLPSPLEDFAICSW